MHLQKMDFCHLTIWQQETLLYVCRFKYVPLFRFRSGSDDLQPSTDVSSLDHDILHLVDQ